MGVEFKKMSIEEQKKLREALRENAETGRPLAMDALTTGWLPDAVVEEVADATVIDAIQSVPCHY